MSVSKLPAWAVVLFLSGATVAYGQATQAPAPGGTVPPVVKPDQPGPKGPGPTPQGGGSTSKPAPTSGH
jgi:hypothetical protein